MGDHGTHPTRYGSLSNDSLYAMYRESVYRSLTEAEKLDLLQETVNRDAAERGELGSPRVQFSNLPHNVSGEARDGVISVNRDLAVNGIQTLTYNGQTLRHPVDDYNIQTLNTVLHENVHCFQDQVIDGTITADARLTAEYQANGFTTSVVQQGNRLSLGSQYLTGETANGYYLYYFQATERDAFRSAEIKTDQILQGITAKYGTEPSFAAYQRTTASTGYQATEQRAIARFQNPDFVKDLNQTLQNQYFNTNAPVDAKTEQAVKAEMVQSLHALQVTTRPSHTTEENPHMSNDFNYTPVTLEAYNQSLRDSVNAYYVHAMNDPNMSKEEAIRSTSEMAERYLNAVDEFKAETAMNENAEAQPVTTASVNNGIDGGSGGIDGGSGGIDGGSGGIDGGGINGGGMSL